jgi:hypothetical protein
MKFVPPELTRRAGSDRPGGRAKKRKVFIVAIQKYKPEITLQKTILCPTGVGHELRSALENGRKNVERSRVLISEIKSVVEQSRLAINASRHLIFKS